MADGFCIDIVVDRTARDGVFLYTCAELPGLFVVHKDDRVAYDDVPRSIQALFKLDHGLNCKVTQKLSYSEFVQQISLKAKARDAVADRTRELMSEHRRFSYTVQTSGEGARR